MKECAAQKIQHKTSYFFLSAIFVLNLIFSVYLSSSLSLVKPDSSLGDLIFSAPSLSECSRKHSTWSHSKEKQEYFFSVAFGLPILAILISPYAHKKKKNLNHLHLKMSTPPGYISLIIIYIQTLRFAD